MTVKTLSTSSDTYARHRVRLEVEGAPRTKITPTIDIKPKLVTITYKIGPGWIEVYLRGPRYRKDGSLGSEHSSHIFGWRDRDEFDWVADLVDEHRPTELTVKFPATGDD